MTADTTPSLALADLKPRVQNSDCPDAWALIFRCPKCRKHEIAVDFWPGEIGERAAKDAGGKAYKLKVWKCRGRRVQTSGDDCCYDLNDISLFPSINRTGLDACGGWHGFINHGSVR